MVSQIKVNEIIKQSGSSITIGESGDTITLPSTATLTNFPANTPAFEAFLSATTSNISNDTDTKITFDTEVFDSDSTFDTSNGRFTPAVSGKYLLYGSVQFLGTSTADSNENIVKLYKNGSQHMVTYWITAIPQGVISWTATVDFNTTDYMEIYAKINNSSGDRKIVGAAANQKYTWFGGHKLIGA
tara:strand:- start:1878 stop:2435 length:558 start_codon:yes stop_codon:yes gene_type:complete